MNGQPLPIAKPKFEFAPTGNLLASPWKFRPYGQSGIEVSELFPRIGSCIDDICVIRSMNGGDQVSHGPALLNINTGSGVFARPSLGAWTLYGLGTENQNLPGFLSLSPSLYHGGAQNYGSAFLPATFQGTRIGDGSTQFQGGQAVGPLAGRRSPAAAAAARPARATEPRSTWSGWARTRAWKPGSPRSRWPSGCRPRPRA